MILSGHINKIIKPKNMFMDSVLNFKIKMLLLNPGLILKNSWLN